MNKTPVGTKQIWIGLKVLGVYGDTLYTGVVYHIESNKATIKRDDGNTGWGCGIKEQPYSGRCGWGVYLLTNGNVGADGTKGILYYADNEDLIKEKTGGDELCLATKRLWS